MGNLTGPSLDLFKFGKLSRCGMKGKPLKRQKWTALIKDRWKRTIIPVHEVNGSLELRRRGFSTYVYQEHELVGSFRLAPVSPEHGMKWMSFFGLKPTFFKNGTSFSLHSSYLKVQQQEKDVNTFKEDTAADEDMYWNRCWINYRNLWVECFGCGRMNRPPGMIWSLRAKWFLKLQFSSIYLIFVGPLRNSKKEFIWLILEISLSSSIIPELFFLKFKLILMPPFQANWQLFGVNKCNRSSGQFPSQDKCFASVQTHHNI